MSNFSFETRNFEGFNNRTGLYQVWVPAHDDGKGPLISIWIDPKMSGFESYSHEEQPAIRSIGEKESTEEIEDSPRR